MENVATFIRAAFKDSMLPPQCSASDVGETWNEQARVKTFFRKKVWTDVNLVWLENYQGDKAACLDFMDEVAFSYYFPAFMLIVLSDESDRSELMIPVVRATNRTMQNNERFDNWIGSLSDQQIDAIGKFLLSVHDRYFKYYELHPGAQPLAIYNKYWNSARRLIVGKDDSIPIPPRSTSR
jgi:hypothetical protein